MPEAKIPPPLDGDPEDVSWALTTAASLQASGDAMEALRWLRKAVTAAVAHDQDGRAIQLGRHAADFEESIAAAPTRREAGADASPQRVRDTLDDEGFDELDQPTHVDPSRRFGDTGAHAPVTQLAGSAPHTPIPPGQRVTSNPESEITLVPFTMKAAGVPDGVQQQIADARAALAKTMPVAMLPDVADALAPAAPPLDVNSTLVTPEALSPDEEHTVAMRRPPNIDEISTESVEPSRSDRASPQSAEVPSAPVSPLARWRVAVVAAADGEPRLLVLKPGTSAPAGSGVGILLPLSSRDAKIIAQLLESEL
jgi:hypothetical protein